MKEIKEIIEELMTKIVRPMGDDLLTAGGIPTPQIHYKKIIESSLLSLQASVEARKDDEFRAAVEKIIQEERFAGAPYALNKLLTSLPKPKDE